MNFATEISRYKWIRFSIKFNDSNREEMAFDDGNAQDWAAL